MDLVHVERLKERDKEEQNVKIIGLAHIVKISKKIWYLEGSKS